MTYPDEWEWMDEWIVWMVICVMFLWAGVMVFEECQRHYRLNRRQSQPYQDRNDCTIDIRD